MTIIKLPTAKCLHCGHEWVIRVLKPVRCPNCKTANYLKRKQRRGRPRKIEQRAKGGGKS